MNRIYKILCALGASILVAEPITLDGNLNEESWKDAFVIENYYETVPYTLKPASVKTITRIFSNEDGIYVGFTNFQDISTMVSNKSLRDEMGINVEQNGVAIDFDSDGSKAYMFMITLADIKKDGIRPLGGYPEMDWDGDWEAKTRKYKNFWISEFFIPWNVALMKPEENDMRKINISTFRYLAKEKVWLNDTKTSGFRVNFLSNMRTIEINSYTKRKLNFFPFFQKHIIQLVI